MEQACFYFSHCWRAQLNVFSPNTPKLLRIPFELSELSVRNLWYMNLNNSAIKSNVHVTQECLLFSSPQVMLNNMDPVDDTF